jgi:branched-chain amino acid transport system substrate-binding protein
MKSKFKFNFTVFIGILSAISLLFFSCSKSTDEIKIGALLPLTGAGSNYGKWERQGIDMAVEEINLKGGINGRPIKILFEDIQSDPKIAVNSFKRLITSDKIPCVLAGISSAVLAMAPIADEDHVVLMNSGGISPKIPEVTGNYVFSNIVDGSIEVKTMANYIFDSLGLKTISIFCLNSAAGTDAKDVFVKEYQSKGGIVKDIEYHDLNANDFRTQLLNLKNAGAEAIYLASFTKESALILKQAQEIGLKSKWFSYAPFEGQDILTVAKDAAEGLIYTSQAFDPNSSDPKVRTFEENYFKKYGEYAEIYAATFYDGVYLLAKAMEISGYTGQDIQSGLRKITEFDGVTGKMVFDSRQVAKKQIIFKIVKDGKFQIYKK